MVWEGRNLGSGVPSIISLLAAVLERTTGSELFDSLQVQQTEKRDRTYICGLIAPFNMATPATSLLADFDFNLTSLTPPRDEAPPLAPPRPPTPDPRRTPTPHPPRPVFRSDSSLSATDNNRKRLRKKPTAIFVGQQTEDRSPNRSPSYWPGPDDVEPLNGLQYHSYHTLPCLLPLFPSTPSPRFATSPSLSSGGSTIQSSPTVTPTTAHFGSFYNDPRPAAKESSALDPWDHNERKYGLRRAKRLPHLDQGLWEVHAVVHIGEGEKDSGSGGKGSNIRVEHEQQSDHYNWCLQQQRQASILESGSAPEPLISATSKTPRAQEGSPVKRKTANSDTRPKGFHGIFSESARREGGLRKASDVAFSTYTLSKFHFPAPPGDYRIGLSGKRIAWQCCSAITDVHYKEICSTQQRSTIEVCICSAATIAVNPANVSQELHST